MLKTKTRPSIYADIEALPPKVLALAGDKWLLAATFKNADSVTAPPFETHTLPLDVLWVPESKTAPPEG